MVISLNFCPGLATRYFNHLSIFYLKIIYDKKILFALKNFKYLSKN
jgi:hypothetical protein